MLPRRSAEPGNCKTLCGEVLMGSGKIFVVGAGHVGATAAAVMAERKLGDIHLYDITRDRAVGNAMDINQSSPFYGTDSLVRGSNDIEDMRGSDVVVVAAGVPRHNGMTRLDLLKKNIDVIDGVGRNIQKFCPNAQVFIVTNPVDVLTWYAGTRWPDLHIFGLGCTLDTIRFQFFLAEALKVSVDSVSSIVIGTHDEHMIPLIEYATVCGLPVQTLLDERSAAEIIRNTIEAGSDIVHKLKERSGFYAAAAAITQVVESIVLNKRHIMPLSIRCNGEYGHSDICLALPVIVGKEKNKEIVEVHLSPEIRMKLDNCAQNMAMVLQNIRIA